MATLQRVPRGQGGLLAGVCAGVAEGLGLSPTLVRILFVVFAVTGIGEIVYLVLWVLMPKASRSPHS